MESESGTNNTKISDSGYSNSCSNTTSQGSASSKSRHSGGSNSSRSSGYGGAPNRHESDMEQSVHGQGPKRNRDRKKKKQKSTSDILVAPSLDTIPQTLTVPSDTLDASSSVKPPTDIENVPLSPSVDLELNVPETLETGIEHSDSLLTTVASLTSEVVESTPTTAEVNDLNPSIAPGESTDDAISDVKTIQPEVMPISQQEINDGFCCVISMYDGVVLYTTPSLTPVLGFPKDTWLGHSFLDYVHPKDRETFSSHISRSVSVPLVDSQGKVKDVRNYFYVCLKRYINKTAGVAVSEKPPYQAFHLTVTIKKMTDSSESQLTNNNNGLFLIILAVPVYSAYKIPGERKKSSKFGLRHTATCIFSYVDANVVTNFGFLPQDMLGKSIFDFYHPEDMPFLKEVYKYVINTCQINGSVFRSKPYRFLVQNGCFAMIETEWSSVINPWSRRLEFVISLHQVLQGPMNPNVFDEVSDKEFQIIPDEIIKQGKVLQSEIIHLLTQELPKPAENGKLEVSKRCKELANFMESFMSTSKLEVEVNDKEYNPSISERDSVMLGEISPHHEFCDSKSSSETPPSYSQLNYYENLNRFFQSNPKTVATSDESTSASNAMEAEEKIAQDPTPNTQKCLSPLQNSGGSGCGSAGNLSSGSNPNLETGTTSGTNTSNDDFKPTQLTASILVRHNEDMEKIMIQRHKKERSHIKDRETKKKLEKHTNDVFGEGNEKYHGVKRSVSHSWEEDCHKMSKHDHNNVCNVANKETKANNQNSNLNGIINMDLPTTSLPLTENILQTTGIWTPPTVNVTTPAPQMPIPISIAANPSYNTNMLPIYYVPTLMQPRLGPNNAEQNQKFQVQYMPAGLVCNYNPVFLPQPILYSTMPVVSLPQQNATTSGCLNRSHLEHNGQQNELNSSPPGFNGSTQNGNENSLQTDQYRQFDNTRSGSNMMTTCDRPSSQATSVKAEPGSRIGSIASASVVNKALSECSRKDLGLQSVCSPGTPLVSPPDGETQAEQFSTNTKTQQTSEDVKHSKQNTPSYRISRMDEESSCYSSSYSSFLKTDTGSGSNDDSASNNNTNRTDDEILKQRRKTYPMRKKDPPWVESISVSPNMIYKYQMTVKNLDEILQMDLNTLKNTEQPMMVNDQLHQLYIEMELEGLSKALTLEEGFSSSSNSSDDNPSSNSNSTNQNKSSKRRSYSSLMMIYEEDAPFPPPEANS